VPRLPRAGKTHQDPEHPAGVSSSCRQRDRDAWSSVATRSATPDLPGDAGGSADRLSMRREPPQWFQREAAQPKLMITSIGWDV
jgi:hypothetical protein